MDLSTYFSFLLHVRIKRDNKCKVLSEGHTVKCLMDINHDHYYTRFDVLPFGETDSITIMDSEPSDLPSLWNNFLLNWWLITKFQVYKDLTSSYRSKSEGKANRHPWGNAWAWWWCCCLRSTQSITSLSNAILALGRKRTARKCLFRKKTIQTCFSGSSVILNFLAAAAAARIIEHGTQILWENKNEKEKAVCSHKVNN